MEREDRQRLTSHCETELALSWLSVEQQLGSMSEVWSSMGTVATYTVDDAISMMGMGRFQYKMLLFTGVIWAADAMEMMLLAFLIPKLKHEWKLERPEDGLISSVVFAGQIVGNALWPIAGDHYGRRPMVIATNLGCAVFGTLSAFSPEIYTMLVCRFAVGVFIGGATVSFTLFAEVAPVDHRGSLLMIEQGYWAVGAVFSVLVAWLTLTRRGGGTWCSAVCPRGR